MTARDHNELCRRLGYRFNDPDLLRRALTHRSYGTQHNERLEFLGDAVLGLSIAAALYDQFPGLREGELTRARASLVRRESLAEIARKLDLGAELLLGGGELKSGGHNRDSILADVLEAVLGAIYLDGGFNAARDAVARLFADHIKALNPGAVLKDPKTELQEYLQERAQGLPEYHLRNVSGRDHAQHFVIECQVPGIAPVTGEGGSRRKAEQQAARRALDLLGVREPA
jgi:ribonuclease-3